MAYTYTANIKLTKPGYDNSADIAVINSNMDKIDAAMPLTVDGVAAVNNNIPLDVVTGARYYNTYTAGGAGDADYITDTFALVPISASQNAELYDALGNTGGYAYVRTSFHGSRSNTSRRYQVAYSYNSVTQRKAWRCYGGNGWLPWQTDAQRGKVILPNGDYAVGASLPFTESPDNYEYLTGRVGYAGIAPSWGGGSGANRRYALSSVSLGSDTASGEVFLYAIRIGGTYNENDFKLLRATRIAISSTGSVRFDQLNSIQIGVLYGNRN